MARVLLLTRSFKLAGAERQIAELAVQLNRRGVSAAILGFYDGPLRKPLESAGVDVHLLGKRGRWDFAWFAVRLMRKIRAHRPEVIYSFLSGPNLASLAMKPATGSPRIVWGVRASGADSAQQDIVGRLVEWFEASGSRWVDAVVCNSEAGKRYVDARGFRAPETVVIANGIDTDRFRPCLKSRSVIRNRWAIDPQSEVVGLVARLHAEKDHPTFLRAAAVAARSRPNIRFVCVGDGPKRYAEELRSLAKSLGFGDRVVWEGSRPDIENVYNALDVATLTSVKEGFPNVIGEAMACGVPCVVTDVGDTAKIVGDTGIVVPSGHPDQLAAGWMRMLDAVREDRSNRSGLVRTRIEQLFSVDRMVDETLAILGLKSDRDQTYNT